MRFRAGGPSGGVSVAVQLRNLQVPSDFPTTEQGMYAAADDWMFQLLRSTYLVIDNVPQRHFFGSLDGLEDDSTHDDRGIPPLRKPYHYETDIRKYSSPLLAAMQMGFGNVGPAPDVVVGENQVFHTTIKGDATPRMDPLYTWGPLSVDFNWNGLLIKMPEQMYWSVPNNRYHLPIYRTNTPSAPPYGYNGTYPTASEYRVYNGQLPGMTRPFNEFAKTLVGIEDIETGKATYLGQWTTLSPVQVHRVFSLHSPGATGSGIAEVRTSHNRISWKQFHSYSGMVVREFDLSFKVVPAQPIYPSGPSNAGRYACFDIEIKWDVKMSWYARPPVRPSPGNPYFDWKEVTYTPTSVRVYKKTTRIAGISRLFSRIESQPEVLPAILADTSLLKGYDDYYQSNLGFFRPAVMLSYADAIAKHRATTTNWVETIAEIKELLYLAPDLAPLLRTGMTFLKLRDSPGSIYGGMTSSFNKKALRHEAASGLLRLGDFFSSFHLLRLFGWRPAASNAQEVTTKLDRLHEAVWSLQSAQTFHGKFTRDDIPFGDVKVSLTARSKVRLKGVSNDFLTAILQLDSIGLAPRSENVWALVQWSWLIDIFTQLNKRYDVLDAVALGHMVGVDKVVHSLTMYQDLPDTVLARYNIQAADEGKLQIKAYAREVSLLVPGIFGGYDFVANPRPLDKGLVAALLWQLGRSL